MVRIDDLKALFPPKQSCDPQLLKISEFDATRATLVHIWRFKAQKIISNQSTGAWGRGVGQKQFTGLVFKDWSWCSKLQAECLPKPCQHHPSPGKGLQTNPTESRGRWGQGTWRKVSWKWLSCLWLLLWESWMSLLAPKEIIWPLLFPGQCFHTHSLENYLGYHTAYAACGLRWKSG